MPDEWKPWWHHLWFYNVCMLNSFDTLLARRSLEYPNNTGNIPNIFPLIKIARILQWDGAIMCQGCIRNKTWPLDKPASLSMLSSPLPISGQEWPLDSIMMAQLQEKETQTGFPIPFLPNDVTLTTVIVAEDVHLPKIQKPSCDSIMGVFRVRAWALAALTSLVTCS